MAGILLVVFLQAEGCIGLIEWRCWLKRQVGCRSFSMPPKSLQLRTLWSAVLSARLYRAVGLSCDCTTYSVVVWNHLSLAGLTPTTGPIIRLDLVYDAIKLDTRAQSQLLQPARLLGVCSVLACKGCNALSYRPYTDWLTSALRPYYDWCRTDAWCDLL